MLQKQETQSNTESTTNYQNAASWTGHKRKSFQGPLKSDDHAQTHLGVGYVSLLLMTNLAIQIMVHNISIMQSEY